jgi:hypothetical protein
MKMTIGQEQKYNQRYDEPCPLAITIYTFHGDQKKADQAEDNGNRDAYSVY